VVKNFSFWKIRACWHNAFWNSWNESKNEPWPSFSQMFHMNTEYSHDILNVMFSLKCFRLPSKAFQTVFAHYPESLVRLVQVTDIHLVRNGLHIKSMEPLICNNNVSYIISRGYQFVSCFLNFLPWNLCSYLYFIYVKILKLCDEF
jgi:hypothetical protein